MEELCRRIAASDLEIDNALDAAFAVEIDGTTSSVLAELGYVYRMSAGYTTHLLDLIITTATADSLSLNNLTLDQIQISLSSGEERPECIQVILRLFSETPHERNIPSVYLLIQAFSLSPTKITRWHGIRTLSSLNGSMSTFTFAHK